MLLVPIGLSKYVIVVLSSAVLWLIYCKILHDSYFHNRTSVKLQKTLLWFKDCVKRRKEMYMYVTENLSWMLINLADLLKRIYLFSDYSKFINENKFWFIVFWLFVFNIPSCLVPEYVIRTIVIYVFIHSLFV